jgi:hypothetical protein
MEEEYGALMSNGTWELVPQPRGSNVITGKWVFTHKFLSDGTFNRYKVIRFSGASLSALGGLR